VPTYAYVCTACDHSFEAVQAITDDALTECPSCGGALRKKFHPVGVTFKGSGFYRTDSRSSSSSGVSGGVGSKESGGAPKESGGGSGTGSKESGGGSGTKAPAGGSGSSGSGGGSSSGSGSSSSGSSSGSGSSSSSKPSS
jgi:putative FmdB family regulatory protein